MRFRGIGTALMMWLMLLLFVWCAGYIVVEVAVDGRLLWLIALPLTLFVVWRWSRLALIVCFTATWDITKLEFRHLWRVQQADLANIVRIAEGKMGEAGTPTYTIVMQDGARVWLSGGNSDEFVRALTRAAPHIRVEKEPRRWLLSRSPRDGNV